MNDPLHHHHHHQQQQQQPVSSTADSDSLKKTLREVNTQHVYLLAYE